MTKRIKNISELPSWFHLEKYNRLNELKAAGWYEQLFVRKDCFIIFSSRDQNNNKNEENNRFKIALNLIRDNPIIDINSNLILSGYFMGGALNELKSQVKLKSQKPNYMLGVRPITHREFNMIENSITPKKLKYLRQWRKNTERHVYQSWIDQPLHESLSSDWNAASITYVDMNLPDNILIEHFKQYLTLRRTEIGEGSQVKNYRTPDFKDWASFGVLPYLDLKLWELESSVSIPNRVMANAIYQSDKYGEETVRKTTAPLAEKLVSEESLAQLAALAAFEITEQNSI